jgi:hypothetical protein
LTSGSAGQGAPPQLSHAQIGKMLLGSPAVARARPRSATLANPSSLFVGLLLDLLHIGSHTATRRRCSCRLNAPFAELVSVKAV